MMDSVFSSLHRMFSVAKQDVSRWRLECTVCYSLEGNLHQSAQKKHLIYCERNSNRQENMQSVAEDLQVGVRFFLPSESATLFNAYLAPSLARKPSSTLLGVCSIASCKNGIPWNRLKPIPRKADLVHIKRRARSDSTPPKKNLRTFYTIANFWSDFQVIPSIIFDRDNSEKKSNWISEGERERKKNRRPLSPFFPLSFPRQEIFFPLPKIISWRNRQSTHREKYAKKARLELQPILLFFRWE